MTLSFVVRTVFIHQLGNEYLGINGLFSNILYLLSFAELGLGTAITFALYKPLADDDKKTVSALMNFFSKAYRIIGCSIFLLGLCLTPFLKYIIGENPQLPPDIFSIKFIFLLYVINISFSYFFNYKRTLIIACQKGRIDSLNQLLFNSTRDCIQIILLLTIRSFYAYLFIQIGFTILANYSISIKADKLFPYLKTFRNERLSSNSITTIKKNVLSMVCHKLGSVVVTGTDSILITHFCGLILTGVYSNYLLLKNSTLVIVQQMMVPITASVGNMIASESKEKNYVQYNRIIFANFYIALLCSGSFYLTANRFVKIFWGNDCLLSNRILLLFSINLYITIMRRTSQIYIDAVGLFWNIKYKSIFEAIINLAASLYLCQIEQLGIYGIILGTIISNITTNFWWEPFVVYKYYFNIAFTRYLYRIVFNTSIALAIVLFAYYCISFIPNTFLGLLSSSIISVTSITLLFILVYFKTQDFKYLLSVLFKVQSIFYKPSKAE